MAVPTRISALTEATPINPTDQLLVARGSGVTGVSYKVQAKNIIAEQLKAINTPSIKLTFNGSVNTLSAEANVIPVNAGGTGLTTLPPNGHILIGNGTGYTINQITPGPGLGVTNGTGTILVEHLTHTNEVTGNTALTIVDNVVSNSKLSDVSSYTLKGRISTAAGDPEDLTPTQARTLLNVDNGANNYIHPAASWVVKPDLAGVNVISNLTIDLSGHPTDWTTRALGTMSIQPSTNVNITGGSIVDVNIQATTPLKVKSTPGTTTYAILGQFGGTGQGSLQLRDAVGNYCELAAGSSSLPAAGSPPIPFTGIIGNTNKDLLMDGNIGAKGVIRGYSGLEYHIPASGWTAAVSDLRCKNITSNYTQGLDDVIKLNPVKFKYKESIQPCPGTIERIGLIAQEVEKVFPNCVYTDKKTLDGKTQDLLHLHEKDFTYAFINAFKDLNSKYEQALKRIELLEAKIN